jgi:hypothetical protein
MNKVLLNSYARNLVGSLFGAVVTVIAAKEYGSPLDLKASDWQAVAHVLWAGALPTLLRYFNVNDSAFGLTNKEAEVELKKAAPKPKKTK